MFEGRDTRNLLLIKKKLLLSDLKDETLKKSIMNRSFITFSM